MAHGSHRSGRFALIFTIFLSVLICVHLWLNHSMNFWLVKSESETYSWAQLVKDGKTAWTGVRNFAARLHLRAMKPGDLV